MIKASHSRFGEGVACGFAIIYFRSSTFSITRKIKNVNLPHNYVHMRLIYVKMKHNHVDM